jgi:hypothetical protein
MLEFSWPRRPSSQPGEKNEGAPQAIWYTHNRKTQQSKMDQAPHLHKTANETLISVLRAHSFKNIPISEREALRQAILAAAGNCNPKETTVLRGGDQGP